MESAHLFADAHERVKVGHGLRDQSQLPSAQLLLPRRIQSDAAIEHLAARHGVVRQDAEHGVRQKALARTARADNGKDLSRRQTQIDAVHPCHQRMLQRTLIHAEGHGQILYFEKFLSHKASYFCPDCGSRISRSVSPRRSKISTTSSSKKPGKNANHHMPSAR